MMIYKDQDIFLNNSIKIVEKYGIEKKDFPILTKVISNGKIYTDELISIIFSDDLCWGIMIRKANNNIFFLKNNGIIILFNNNYLYLEEHLKKILAFH